MMLATMGAGMTLNSIAQALQGGGNQLSTSIRSPLASRVTIYGQARVAGTIVYMSSIRYTMNQVIAWASHQCKSVDFIYLDGREVIFLGNNSKPVAGAWGFDQGGTFYDTAGNAYNFGGDNDGNYHVYAQNALGTAAGEWLALGTGTASPGDSDGLVWADPLWVAECTLNGICATFLACSSNANMFASIPGLKASIHGKCDIYDPRLGAQYLSDGVTPNPATHIWTDNAALIWADHMTNTDFGVGCGWDEIDIDQLIVAANICDEQVELAGVTQPWESQLNVSLGSQILDSNGNIETAINVPTDGVGECGTTEPTWPTTLGGTVRDGNVTWQMTPAGPVTAAWAANETVAPGTRILDLNGNIETAGEPIIIGAGWSYGGGGTTGSTVPAWPTTAGGQVIDGTVTWTMSPPATTESRYTINGSFDWSAAPGDIQSSILAAMEAKISYQGGVWKLFPAAWYGSTLSFDMGDLTGPIKWSPRRKFRDLFNAVRASFICPSYPYAVSGFDKNHKNGSIFDGQYQPTDAPEYAQDALHGYASDVNLAADAGIKLYTDVRYQFVTSVATCQRLMKIRLMRNRYQGTGTLQMSLAAYQTCPVDVIQLTAAPLSWLNKYMEIEEFHFVASAKSTGEDDSEDSHDEEQALTLGVQVDVNETDPSIYSWSPAEELSLENISSPQLQNSLQVADPSGLTLESDISTALVSANGTVTPRILVAWTEPDDPFVTSGGKINVQYQVNGASSWQSAPDLPGIATSCYLSGLSVGYYYSVQIRSEHAGGAVGNWVQAGPVVCGTQPASGASSVAFAITVTAAGISISWAAQTVDGYSVPAGSISFAGLTATTLYYLYPYITTSSGVLSFAGQPASSPSYTQSIQAAAPGQLSLGVLTVATADSGSPIAHRPFPIGQVSLGS
jgi:hypothetical protein